MKKEIGWRERKKEGRGLFFSSSDIDNLIFTITILKKRRVLASIDQAVQPQSIFTNAIRMGGWREKKRGRFRLT